MAKTPKATAIRTLIARYTGTIRRGSALVNGGWGAKVHVSLRRANGDVLPENNPEALRTAYHQFLGWELVAAEGKAKLRALVEEIHGPEVLAYMIGNRDYRDVPTINQEV